MWGLLFRFTGARLESSIPGFLASAGATYHLLAYMERCVEELARDPARYGYDPGSSYTVLAQTWDRALTPARSLAWGRQKLGEGAVRLIPDFYYTTGAGFAHLRQDAAACPPWRERHPALVWRGALNWGGMFSHPAEIPRARLTLLCRDIAGTDVRLTKVGETMTHALPLQELIDYVAAEHLLGDSWPMSRFGDYRHVIDIDGYGNAWGLMEKLILGCCVLKVETPYEQWFYDRLRPWVHYVPIRADLSDLEARVAWCRENPDECEWIAANGRRLADTASDRAELERSCREIMAVARASRSA